MWWVECDDCNRWYHVKCTNLDLNLTQLGSQSHPTWSQSWLTSVIIVSEHISECYLSNGNLNFCASCHSFCCYFQVVCFPYCNCFQAWYLTHSLRMILLFLLNFWKKKTEKIHKLIVWKFDEAYQETQMCIIENNCKVKPKSRVRFILYSFLILLKLILDSAIICYL